MPDRPRVPMGAQFPANPSPGDLFFNQTTNQLYIFTPAGTWVAV